MTRWPRVALNSLLTLRPADTEVRAEVEYPFAGVYCFGKGVFPGQKKYGTQFTYKKLTRLKSGNFVYPKLMAWEGALGVVPPVCNGLYVSPEFPVFEIDQQQVHPLYLDYYFRRPATWPELSGGSTGTNVRRRRLHPSDFLKYQLPLPTLPEQKAIVDHLKAITTRLQAAAKATSDVHLRCQHLLASAFRELTEGTPRARLKEIAPLTRRPAVVDPSQTYPGVSVRSFGRGAFHNPPQQGSEITWEKPHLVKSGDILISNIKAWEGAIAVAGPLDDGRYGSHRYLTYRPVEGVATARFVCFYLLTPEGLHQVGEASPGSADRNRTTSARGLEEIPVPLPSYERQLWFGELYDKVELIRRLQAESTAGREALLPAVLERAFRGEL